MEQFVFCYQRDAHDRFDMLVENATAFLQAHNIEWRVRDVTHEDSGYHHHKVDIEVLTQTYGWLETHSCTYYADEQTSRFNIKGNQHTLSNTAIASPRILVPFLERL